jgi:hypothetical protein
MGKNFIEKVFYFLERPPAAREHEWEHHMVSLGLGINRRGTGKEGKGTRGNRSSSSVQRRDTSANHTSSSTANRSHRRKRRSQTAPTAARGNRRGTSRRSWLPVVVGNDNRRGRSGNHRGRAENRKETAGGVRITRTRGVRKLATNLKLCKSDLPVNKSAMLRTVYGSVEGKERGWVTG